MSAVSSEIFIESVAQNACESLADVILIELVYAHRRGIILARESTAAAFAGVSRCFRLRLIWYTRVPNLKILETQILLTIVAQISR